MYIIGVSGKKSHGKDAVYEAIVDILKPAKIVRIAFADALKEEVAKACGVSVDYINKHKAIFRPILQWWGTEFRRKLFRDDYWLLRWAERANKVSSDTHAIIAPDTRFINEADFIKKVGGFVVRVERKNLPIDTDAHQSEVDLDNGYEFDDYIPNNGTLADLKSFTILMLSNIQHKYNERRATVKHTRDIHT